VVTIKIICKNQIEEEITFAHRFPYWLENTEGLFSASSDVITVKNSLAYGEIFSGISTNRRNIVIMAKIRGDYKMARDKLERMFAPRLTGTLTCYIDNYHRKIDYIAENFEITNRGKVRTISISLICPDPQFRGETIYYYRYETIGLIHFPIYVGKQYQVANYRFKELINIVNDTTSEQGLIFRITARHNDIALNFCPEIANVNTGEHIKLDTMKLEHGLIVGQYIEVSTSFGNKYIDVIRGNERTRLNSMWQLDNTWIQAHKGDNVFRLSAQHVKEYDLNLTIIYTPTYWRC
jgi:hypothetical protein